MTESCASSRTHNGSCEAPCWNAPFATAKYPVEVLTVGYPGGRTRQISLQRGQVRQVREWLDNYHRLRDALEQVCELNQQLLRPESK